MKVAEREQFAEGLRRLADFIEENGENIPVPYRVNLYNNVNQYDEHYEFDAEASREKIAEVARVIGSCDKEFNDYELSLTKEFGHYVTLKYTVKREAVCEREVVGTKHIDEVTFPARDEEIVEWKCTNLALLK